MNPVHFPFPIVPRPFQPQLSRLRVLMVDSLPTKVCVLKKCLVPPVNQLSAGTKRAGRTPKIARLFKNAVLEPSPSVVLQVCVPEVWIIVPRARPGVRQASLSNVPIRPESSEAFLPSVSRLLKSVARFLPMLLVAPTVAQDVLMALVVACRSTAHC